MTPGDDFISGWKTGADWEALRNQLVIGDTPNLWEQARTDFFETRLKSRYLNPIRLLQEHGTHTGEGFSIMALQCTLIEFLESTMQGKHYRYVRPPQTLGPHQYSSSASIFTAFLTTREPFSSQFEEASADEFYRNIRCGLLHEARTKGGWRIWAQSSHGTIIDPAAKIVYRDDFQHALEESLKIYSKAMLGDADLQRAFIRKFDNLCS